VGAAKLTSSSNVFYLPAVSVPEAPPAPRWARLTRTWWRVRFAVAGIRLALKPAPIPLFAEDETLALLQGQAVLERRARSTRPAHVIDFDAARARLRPVAAAQ